MNNCLFNFNRYVCSILNSHIYFIFNNNVQSPTIMFILFLSHSCSISNKCIFLIYIFSNFKINFKIQPTCYFKFIMIQNLINTFLNKRHIF